MMKDNIYKIAAQINRATEESIKKALPDGFPLEEVAERCELKRMEGTDYETLYLDGRPVMTRKDPGFTVKEEGDKVTLTITQEVAYHE